MQLSDAPAALSAADLRAMRARQDKPIEIYVLAARTKIHPSRLGQLLNGSLPLSAEVASRIAAALQDESGAAYSQPSGDAR